MTRGTESVQETRYIRRSVEQERDGDKDTKRQKDCKTSSHVQRENNRNRERKKERARAPNGYRGKRMDINKKGLGRQEDKNREGGVRSTDSG